MTVDNLSILPRNNLRVILLHTTCPISLRAFYLHVSFKNFKNKTEYNWTYMSCWQASSASSGRVGGVGVGVGIEKHEIYAAAFGSHLFMTYFYRVRGAHGPLASPTGSATAGRLFTSCPLLFRLINYIDLGLYNHSNTRKYDFLLWTLKVKCMYNFYIIQKHYGST